MKKLWKKRVIKLSWLWIPYLVLLQCFPLSKILGYLCLILTIHECGHMLVATYFQYKIQCVTIYPFGLSASIAHIGHGDLIKEALILIAGPLAQLFVPILFYFLVLTHQLSAGFYEYLCWMNLGIAIFNLLPIYPLDGGRLLQTIIHAFVPYKVGNMITYGVSFLLILCCLCFIQSTSMLLLCISIVVDILYHVCNVKEECLQFYFYRYRYPKSGKQKIHEKKDLYRGFFNVFKTKNGIIKENQWLERYFSSS